MRMNITGINFNYDEGFENEYTSVDLSYVTSGINCGELRGPTRVTREEYQEASGSSENLKSLIKQKIVDDLQA